MLQTEAVSPPDVSEAVAAAKANWAAAAAERQAVIDQAKAAYQPAIDAKAAATAADAQAKAAAQQERVESALRFDASRGWQGSREDFDAWWLAGGRLQTLAAAAARRQAESARQLQVAAADW